nr:MAG TPA: hypothetical protein [Caudoviricetes sp.]
MPPTSNGGRLIFVHKICTKCGLILLYIRLFSHLLSVFMLLDAFYSFPECWYKGISGFLFPFIFGCFFPPVHKMCTS